jgi:homoserine O-succinyltransferase
LNEDASILDRARAALGAFDAQASAGTLTIGFLNNMPEAAVAAAERQFCRVVTTAAGPTPIRLRPFSLNGASAKYSGFDALWDAELDGLIVTGTEPHAVDLRDEPYWHKLTQLYDWADANAVPMVLSCLAAHAAVLHGDGIQRRRLADKRFGLFDHAPVGTDTLLRGLGPSFEIPHSRWNELDEAALTACGYRVLTRSPTAGPDLFVKQRRSLVVHFQGHPEYEPATLALEYRRDVKRFLDGVRETYPTLPVDYFDRETEAQLEAFRRRAMADPRSELLTELPCSPTAATAAAPWHDAAVTIYGNWLDHVRDHKAERPRGHAVVVPVSEPLALEPASPDGFAAIVAAIFERILACDPVDWDDDFFDLGGDSILALTLMAEIEKATELALPLTAIYDAPTARTLGRLLSEKDTPQGSLLVPLKPGLDATPIFLVHGVGGSVMELRGLARLLDTPHAVYGIQARGLDGAEPPLDSVEAMAALYAEEIIKIQPTGPYRLVGFSFGGLIALELAQLLTAAGQEIGLLALLDTLTHTRFWPLRSRVATWAMLLKLQTSLTVWKRAGQYYAATIRRLPLREVAPYLLTRAGRALRSPFSIFQMGAVLHRFVDPDGVAAVPGLLHGLERPPALEQVAAAGHAAFCRYRPRVYAGDVTFVKAADEVRMPFDARLLWGGTLRKLTVHPIPGDHWSLVKTNVGALAAVLSTAIGRAETGSAS